MSLVTSLGMGSWTPECLKGVVFPTLDKGFVRLVDHMGSDWSIDQSARVSYKSSSSYKKERTAEQVSKLLHSLMRDDHASPFEMGVLVFHARLPIFVMRQLVRHRTARLNEMSGRYSVLPSDAYVPEASRIAKQSKTNKQGSGDWFTPEEQSWRRGEFLSEQAVVFDKYRERIESGMARETARINLPLSSYTEVYWQMDVRNLLHMLGLRLDSHAQYEIQQTVLPMAFCLKALFPACFASWEEHQFRAVKLSAAELASCDSEALTVLARERQRPPIDFTQLRFRSLEEANV